MFDFGKPTPGFAHLTPTPAFDPDPLPPDPAPTDDGDPFPGNPFADLGVAQDRAILDALAAVTVDDLIAWAVDFERRTGIGPRTPAGAAPIVPEARAAELVARFRNPPEAVDPLGRGAGGDFGIAGRDGCVVPTLGDPEYNKRVLFDDPALPGCDLGSCRGGLRCDDLLCPCRCHAGDAPVAQDRSDGPFADEDPDFDTPEGDDLGTIIDPGDADDDDPLLAPAGELVDDAAENDRWEPIARLASNRIARAMERRTVAHYHALQLQAIDRVRFLAGVNLDAMAILSVDDPAFAAFADLYTQAIALIRSWCADLTEPVAQVRHSDGTATAYRAVMVY